MNRHQVIADEVLEKVELALKNGNNWMAYNNSLYFIDKDDVHFFDKRSSAIEFANDNVSEYDNYNVMHVSSIADLLRKVPYEESLNNRIINPDANGLYNKEGNAFTDAYIDHLEQQQSLNNKNKNVMNEQNLEYLKDNVKYMGFGEKLNDQLENNLKIGKEAFQLVFKAVVNNKPFDATLHFRKSENSDMYFFNSFDASLKKNNDEKVDQTFYLNKGKGVTAKEAFNLLDGRAVHKELTNKDNVPYKAWLQLDFANKDKHNNFEVKQFHENYGYDLKDAVSKFAIADLKDGEKEKALMQSLQKGNIQAVTIEKDGSSNKMFIEANPQFKSVTLYDGQMKRVQKESLDQYKSVNQSQANEVSQEKKQELKPDVKKDVKQNVSDNLDGAKKKSSRKKGISV